MAPLTAANITFDRKYRYVPTTGVVGVATALCTYRTGSPRVLIEGIDGAGRPFESWYEVSDVEFAD